MNKEIEDIIETMKECNHCRIWQGIYYCGLPSIECEHKSSEQFYVSFYGIISTVIGCNLKYDVIDDKIKIHKVQ